MKRFLSTILFTVFTFGFISLSFGAEPYTWFVDDDNPSETPPWCSSIQQAVERAYAGNDIMIWPGTYNTGDDEEVTINNKEMIQLHAQNPNDKPVISILTITGNTRNSSIKNCKIKNLKVTNSSPEIRYITIENCDLGPDELGAPYSIAVFIENYAYQIDEFFIKNCNIFGNRITGKRGAGIEVNTGGDVKLHFVENDFIDCDVGVWTIPPTGTESGRGYTIYMQGNTFTNCQDDHYDQVGDVNWEWSECPICPTYFKTPNYPSNYNNNDIVSAVLNPPSSGGYTVVVNGETEYGNDYLYIREIDGTLITQLSGQKSNYEVLINSNRSVKVEFLSNSTVTYEGYKVTVESPWTTGISYTVNDVVLYEGAQWVNNFAHTSQVDWYPGAPGLWFWELLEIVPPENWTTNVWYVVGDIVLYNNETWKCTYAHTSQVDWYPGAPGLWFWELQE